VRKRSLVGEIYRATFFTISGRLDGLKRIQVLDREKRSAREKGWGHAAGEKEVCAMGGVLIGCLWWGEESALQKKTNIRGIHRTFAERFLTI